jgi:hypothetical protein
LAILARIAAAEDRPLSWVVRRAVNSLEEWAEFPEQQLVALLADQAKDEQQLVAAGAEEAPRVPTGAGG